MANTKTKTLVVTAHNIIEVIFIVVVLSSVCFIWLGMTTNIVAVFFSWLVGITFLGMTTLFVTKLVMANGR